MEVYGIKMIHFIVYGRIYSFWCAWILLLKDDNGMELNGNMMETRVDLEYEMVTQAFNYYKWH